MKIGILIASFIFTGTVVTGQDDLIPLFNPACCLNKNVGGQDYILVKGSVKGYGCLNDCVYEAIGTEGSRYCFASGQLKVTSLQTETEFQGVHVTSSTNPADSTDTMSFNTDIGFITCTGLVPPFKGQSITCSQPGESDSSTNLSTAGPGLVPFIYSKSEGNLRYSLHSKQVFIDCICLYILGYCSTYICFGNPATDWNTIYVEAALPLDLGIDTMEKCAETCSKNSTCKFWSFSDIKGKDWGPATSSPHLTDNDHEHRNHVGENECGIRTYPAEVLIKTANGQSCGLRQENCGQDCASNVKEGMVYVAKMFPYDSESQCLNACNADHKCNSWTFEYPTKCCCYPGLCVLNYGITQRRINICPFVKCGNRAVIVSGNRTEPLQ